MDPNRAIVWGPWGVVNQWENVDLIASAKEGEAGPRKDKIMNYCNMKG
jgi:hypothetical protein